MTWSPAEAEAWLGGLDPIGWRFGLERIRRLCELLGLPQNRFASVHVVGSNGKSSVAAMTSALLRESGMRTGTYVSPHLERWSERVRLDGEEIEGGRFAAACERTAEAVVVLERALERGGERGPDGAAERVTQFEAATAAAFMALATAGVDAGVIEAGLGGRLDATNVIASRVTALSSVSLEHTDLLGDTEEQIAAEKLAVLRTHTTLVVGRVSDGVARLAAETARERSAALVGAAEREAPVPEAVSGRFQRRNFAVALGAAEAFLGRSLEPAAIERAAGAQSLPGRAERVEADPPVLLDGAHNPAAVAALVESIPELVRGRAVVAVLAALADKPAAEICAPLGRVCAKIICTEVPSGALRGMGRPGARAHAASALAAACPGVAGGVEHESDPRRALASARDAARAAEGVVLVTGSFYLVAALRRVVLENRRGVATGD